MSDQQKQIKEELFAHVRKLVTGEWDVPQDLMEHLEAVASLAASFGKPFGSAAWAYAAGIGHDIGKSSPEWQQYLIAKSGYGKETGEENQENKTMEHSTSSAQIVEQELGKRYGRILSYLIMGHHAGLPDWTGDGQGSLQYRLQQPQKGAFPEKYRKMINTISGLDDLPWKFSRGLDISLWMRMLFSCLVDADYLDTERYMEPEHSKKRSGYLPLSELKNRFDAYMSSMTANAIEKHNTVVNRMRQIVLHDCLAAAKLTPGFFSLTVPTGGGKTLSSLGFALHHAQVCAKERIVYVMPYTSIIEQNASVFREVLGYDQVVEHHSNVDGENDELARLAMENWDAPVVVTTTVQFYESLFASKPGRCRKLHNIVNSVIILDEAQMIPAEYLKPILETLQLLVSHFGISVVLCTATQPMLQKQDAFPEFPGIPAGSIREIIQDVPSLYRNLRRVDIASIDVGKTRSWEELAHELSTYERVLCIVSDRKSCRELYHLMPEGTYHLSALMCPQHRSNIITEIKEKLKRNEQPVRVISTQVVEAGVDIDFPVVYRSMAGLDSIAQAAGRCNREGLLSQYGKLGKVVVFVGPRKPPVGMLRKAYDTTEAMVHSGLKDYLAPESFETFFTELYWKANSLDAKNICEILRPKGAELEIQFRTASESFHLIDDSEMKTIFVPYREGANLIAYAERNPIDRWILRKLQRFSVQIYENQFQELLSRGSLEELFSNSFALRCPIEYSVQEGLLIQDVCINPVAYMM